MIYFGSMNGNAGWSHELSEQKVGKEKKKKKIQ